MIVLLTWFHAQEPISEQEQCTDEHCYNSAALHYGCHFNNFISILFFSLSSLAHQQHFHHITTTTTTKTAANGGGGGGTPTNTNERSSAHRDTHSTSPTRLTVNTTGDWVSAVRKMPPVGGTESNVSYRTSSSGYTPRPTAAGGAAAFFFFFLRRIPSLAIN